MSDMNFLWCPESVWLYTVGVLRLCFDRVYSPRPESPTYLRIFPLKTAELTGLLVGCLFCFFPQNFDNWVWDSFLKGFLPQNWCILRVFMKWDPLFRIFWTKMEPMWWKGNPFGPDSTSLHALTLGLGKSPFFPKTTCFYGKIWCRTRIC